MRGAPPRLVCLMADLADLDMFHMQAQTVVTR